MTAVVLELIQRLEKTTGPDRELDCLIFESKHKLLTPERRGTYYGKPTGEYYGIDGVQLPERAPLYTESVDVALTLVPNDFDYEVTINGTAGEPTYTCAAIRWWREGRERNAAGWLHRSGNAKTTAVAICIAALKAREAIRTPS